MTFNSITKLQVPHPGDARAIDDFLRKLVFRLKELDWLIARQFIVNDDGDQVFNEDGDPVVGPA